MVNSYSALVPPTTSSLFSEVSYHDNIHVPQIGFHILHESSRNDATVDNTVALTPHEATPVEHNCELQF